jgi:hypothetical protein
MPMPIDLLVEYTTNYGKLLYSVAPDALRKENPMPAVKEPF